MRWNNPTDENDARRIQDNCDQLATYGLVLDRAMVDTRLAMLIDEQKSTVSSKPQLLAAKDKGVLVADATAAGPDDASSVSSAAGGARVVAPASMHHVPLAGVAELNLRPDEERRFTQFFMAHVRFSVFVSVGVGRLSYARARRCTICGGNSSPIADPVKFRRR